MSTTMRAKFYIESITQTANGETLKLRAVGRTGDRMPYPEDGSDEDNTYAKFSPQGELSLFIANPALHGKFNPGEKFYLDFTPAT